MTYTVRLEPSGHTFLVTEDDVILDAGLAAGFAMPHGCRGGTCKSCRAKVISGTVDVGRAFPAPPFLLRLRQANGYTLMCRATASSDVVIAVDERPKLAEARTLTAEITGVTRLASDVAVLRLRLPNGERLTFEAGQYVDLLLPDGVRRSYSIANAPQPEGVEILEFHVRHLPGGAFTDVLFAGGYGVGLQQIEAPLGSFCLRETSRPALMLASGTGYAPIRSILLDFLPRNSGRKVLLYWGARSLTDLYLIEEAQDLAAQYPDFTFVPVLSEPRAGDAWQGRTGLVHEAVMADHCDLSGWQVYSCGTPLMVEAARRDFPAHCALPQEQFFADPFITQADVARGA